jgi:excisionase family DNA binding protein
MQSTEAQPESLVPKRQQRKVADLLSKTEALRIVGCSRPTVEALLARGELDGVMVAGRQLITRASAERARKAWQARTPEPAEQGDVAA